MAIYNKIKNLFSKKTLENLDTKRLRIQRHFQDMSLVESCAFTVSSEPLSKAILGGYFLQINAKDSVKSLKVASEGYCLDERSSHILSPLLYTLSHLYCLQLELSPAIFYITSPPLLTALQNLDQNKDPISRAVFLLLKALPKVDIHPCIKGVFFEKMQSTLYKLRLRESNEVTLFDFKLLADIIIKEDD